MSNASTLFTPQRATALRDEPPGVAPAAAAIVVELSKCRKTLRLYERKNRIVAGHLERLWRAVTAFLEEHGELQLAIGPYELSFDGETVYRDDNKDTSLASRLYSDGLRSLALTDDLTESSLLELLEILNLEQPADDTAEDDIVTLLWDRNLGGVEYEVAEEMLHLSGDGPGVDAFLESDDPESQWDNGDTRSGSGDRADVDTKELDQLDKPTSLPTESINLTDAEQAAITSELRRDSSRNLLSDVQEVLFETVHLSQEPHERERLTEVAATTLRSLLEADVGHHTMVVVMRIMVLHELYFSDSEPVRPLADALVQILAEPSGVSAIGRMAEQLPASQLPEVKRVLRSLPYEATAAMIAVVERSRVARVRQLFGEVVCERGSDWLDRLLRALGEAPLPAARDILDVVAGIEDGSRVLLKATAHDHPSVRRHALQHLLEVDPEAARPAIRHCFADSDPLVRSVAMSAIAIIGGPNEIELLRATIDGKAFMRRASEERRVLLSTYATVGGDEALRFLRELLLRRSGFGRRHRVSDSQHAAVAIARLRTPEARVVLQEAERAAESQVRKTCRSLLTRFDRRGPR